MPNFKFKTEGKFSKNLVRDYKLVPLLDAWMSREITGFHMELVPKQKDLGWHPSGDCTPGAIELYHDAMAKLANGHEVKHSKAFLVGHFWHALLEHAVVQLELAEQTAIERTGIRHWAEDNSWGPTPSAKLATPKPFCYCTGSADVAPLTLESGEYVVDFKTMSNQQYGRDDTPLPAWVAQKYEAQINIYMDFFDIDQGLILVIQKDTPHHMKEFMYKRNPHLIRAIYDKWQFVSECIEAGEEPTQQDDDAFSLNGLFEGPTEE